MKLSKFSSLFFSFAVLFGSLAPLSGLYAQGTDEEFTTGARCDAVEARVDRLVNRFEANKERHVEVYNKRKSSIRHLVNKLKSHDVDTSELEADLATLDGLITDYAAAYVQFINLLKEAQQFKCGESDGKFAEKVKAAREQMKIVHEKAKTVREFITGTLEPDLQELKQEVREKRSNRGV